MALLLPNIHDYSSDSDCFDSSRYGASYMQCGDLSDSDCFDSSIYETYYMQCGNSSDSEDNYIRNYNFSTHNKYNDKKILLHKAIDKRCQLELEYLLNSGTTDIDAVDRGGNTPLHLALLKSFDPAIDLLLNRGVSVNAKNCNNKMPLHFAVLIGKDKYITVLIDKGADINSKDKKGKTPLTKAVEINSESAVRLLVAKHCNINVLDKNGNTPLHIALNRRFWKIAELLLTNGSDLAKQNKNGETPLHIAAYKGNYSKKILLHLDEFPLMTVGVNDFISIWKLLLAKDAEDNFQALNLKNNRNNTALHIAAVYYRMYDKYHSYSDRPKAFYFAKQQGYEEFCKALIAKGAMVNEKDENGNAPIHIAVDTLHTGLLETILNSGADVNIRNKYEETPLHIALRQDRQEQCKLLVAYGADVNLYDGKKQTPLHIAAREGYTDLWSLLILSGANANARNKDGNNPLLVVARSERSLYFNFILDNYSEVNYKNDKGATALHFAAAASIDAEEKCKLLIDRGANVNVKDNYNRTPLHIAVMKKHLSVCTLLIDNGAVINTRNTYGSFPLHLAAKSRHLEILTCLLDRGADLKLKDERGETALHCSVGRFWASETMCKLLLDRGADVAARDKNSQTPLHFAAIAVSVPVVQLLLDAGAEVNAQDKEGQTPMHLLDQRVSSTYSSDFERESLSLIVKDMLEWGASSTLENKRGETPFHYISNKLYSEIYVIKNHMTKCKLAKLYIDLECIIYPNITSSNDFETSCLRELKAIKDITFGHYSLLDVFSQYGNPKYITNCEIEAALASKEMSKFPIYGTLLKSTFRRAKERGKLLDRVQDVLGMPLPEEMVRHILSYVGDHDLENVIKARESFINDNLYDGK